ncbi:phosphoribosyltransferase [Palleronia sp. KMU-117]|uniref:phosphoribosyltransferase n=1 Tax=Palleronia sp. KMU-117 TaxID=3434108 RepID=UPI003D72ECBF
MELDRFADRREAGQELAKRLEAFRGTDAVVSALPRGGVPVAAEVARALGLPLTLTLVRKIGVPQQPELAAAAIAGPGGEHLIENPAVVRSAGLDRAQIEALAARERGELLRRAKLYLSGRPEVPLRGRTVLVVDDGLATGATMEAAVAALKAIGAARVIVAVPVGAADTVQRLASSADEVVCLRTPTHFYAVGAHYRDFPQTSDDEVARLLDEAGPAG